ncbi:hypothetical protein EI555_007597 [Monodon monoceros]|uniref:Ferritin light chain n=1 Tax=Monodon monoceros TaxID=40151 RepID=A0A4U1EID6_MONMO|nr:hypothetical protein EI555_007597 [Monodon monoceros]
MRKQWGGRAPLQDGQEPSPEEWGANVGATEAAAALERSLDRTLLDLQTPASASAGAQICEFLETRFRQEELIKKLLKQMGVHLTDLRSLAGPPGRTGRVSFRKAVLPKRIPKPSSSDLSFLPSRLLSPSTPQKSFPKA